MRNVLWAVIWVGMSVAPMACSSIYDIDNSSASAQNVPAPHNFAQINEQVLKTGCANFSVCHSAMGAKSANNLDLETDPYMAMVGAMSVNKKASEEQMMRVKPCDPEQSLLYVKLVLPPTAARGASGYGAHMPQNGALAQTQLDGIHDWIARGALENEPDDATGTTCQTSP